MFDNASAIAEANVALLTTIYIEGELQTLCLLMQWNTNWKHCHSFIRLFIHPSSFSPSHVISKLLEKEHGRVSTSCSVLGWLNRMKTNWWKNWEATSILISVRGELVQPSGNIVVLLRLCIMKDTDLF